MVVALAKVVFVAHGEPGGEIEWVAARAQEWGKPVLTFEEWEHVEETVGRIREGVGGGRKRNHPAESPCLFIVRWQRNC